MGTYSDPVQDAADRAAAADPATPPARLAALAVHHLDAVLGNPGLPLLVLERPDFWMGLPGGAHMQLARHACCPLVFGAWAAADPLGDPCVKAGLALNRALPLDVRRRAFLSQPLAGAGHRYPPDPEDERPLWADFPHPLRAGAVESG